MALCTLGQTKDISCFSFQKPTLHHARARFKNTHTSTVIYTSRDINCHVTSIVTSCKYIIWSVVYLCTSLCAFPEVASVYCLGGCLKFSLKFSLTGPLPSCWRSRLLQLTPQSNTDVVCELSREMNSHQFRYL